MLKTYQITSLICEYKALGEFIFENVQYKKVLKKTPPKKKVPKWKVPKLYNIFNEKVK